MTSTALFQSGVLVPNALMQEQISMGGHLLNIPAWADLQSPADGGTYPNISNDNPAQTSTPNKLAAINQIVRKSYLNNSWSAASFAGELDNCCLQALEQFWSRACAPNPERSVEGFGRVTDHAGHHDPRLAQLLESSLGTTSGLRSLIQSSGVVSDLRNRAPSDNACIGDSH